MLLKKEKYKQFGKRESEISKYFSKLNSFFELCSTHIHTHTHVHSKIMRNLRTNKPTLQKPSFAGQTYLTRTTFFFATSYALTATLK